MPNNKEAALLELHRAVSTMAGATAIMLERRALSKSLLERCKQETQTTSQMMELLLEHKKQIRRRPIKKKGHVHD